MNVVFVVLLLAKVIVSQNLTLCGSPRIDSECDLICKTPDLKKTVEFKKQHQLRGSCAVVFVKPICTPYNNRFNITQNKSKNETHLKIKTLDKNEDEGTWYCEYDKTQSNEEILQTYDKLDNTSLYPNPKVSKIDGFVIIEFQADCMTPEPTAWLNCKNGEERCKVFEFEEKKCRKQNLKLYNVTCNTTAECFHGDAAKVEIKVYDYIRVGGKDIPYHQTNSQVTGNKYPKSRGQVSTIIIIILCISVVMVTVIGIVVFWKYRSKLLKVWKKKKQNSEELHQQDTFIDPKYDVQYSN